MTLRAMQTPALSIIISTYNQPDWLEKALWGWAHQTDRDFELLIADDGSGPATKERIEKTTAEFGLRHRHVWQLDRGFRKCAILNTAIAASTGDYLIISDGDCIPRRDFVAAHRKHARPGCYLSGGYTRLPASLSQRITRDDITSGRAFEPAWLAEGGVASRPWHKHVAQGAWAAFCNRVTTSRPTWNGHNASGWKTDLLRVNGFNELMGYGGLDRELGERLVNAGVVPVQIRYHAIALHLDHSRPYATPASRAANQLIRDEVRRKRLTWTPIGIQKAAASMPSHAITPPP